MLLETKMFKVIVLTIFIFFIGNLKNNSSAQSVGISATSITPDASSILEMRTTSKGILIPRMTTVQRDAISSPANGLIIYNTDLLKINYYDGTVWRVLYLGTNSITGTTNRISVSGTSTDPIVDISSSYTGQATITTLGTISAGSWNAGTIPTLYGGTGTTAAPSTGGIIYGASNSAYASTSGTATAGQILRSGASSAPSWSTATYPAAAGTSGTLLTSNGTNIINTTATYPSTGGTAGTLLTSNGTNFVASAAGSSGQILRSAGAGIPSWSTATYPATSNNAGAILSSDGTNFTAGALTNSSNAIATDITLTTPAYTDGPNITLAAGTWLITGTITCSSGIANGLMAITAKLWDGTTTYASSESYSAKGGGPVVTVTSVSLTAIITIATSKTLKIAAADFSGNAALMKAALPNNPVGNNASFINAVRIGN